MLLGSFFDFLFLQLIPCPFGTTSPKATLDVTGTPATATTADGIIAPRLTGDELAAKTAYGADQTAAQVYVTAAATTPAGATVNVTAPGYYYFDGTVWQKVSTGKLKFVDGTIATDAVYTAGNVGIGTATVTNTRLSIDDADTNTTVIAFKGTATPGINGVKRGIVSEVFTLATDATDKIGLYGDYRIVSHKGSGISTNNRLYNGSVDLDGSGTMTEALFAEGRVQNNSNTGTISSAVMYRGAVINWGAGEITNAYGTSLGVYNFSSGTITNAHGVHVNMLNNGTITNGYGVRIDNIYGTNKWAVYSSDATAPSFFAGNVGIGTTTPNAQLQLGNTATNRKIVLYEDTNNEHQYYGLGINGGLMRYQVSTTNSNHIFFAGSSATTSNELMRIQGNGNVGMGTNAPTAKLDVVGYIKVGSSDASGDATPSPGMIRYNTTTNKFEGYVGGGTPGWVDLN